MITPFLHIFYFFWQGSHICKYAIIGWTVMFLYFQFNSFSPCASVANCKVWFMNYFRQIFLAETITNFFFIGRNWCYQVSLSPILRLSKHFSHIQWNDPLLDNNLTAFTSLQYLAYFSSSLLNLMLVLKLQRNSQ